MADAVTAEPETEETGDGKQTQAPVKGAPWITMFPKSVRGDDMLTWGATPEEMVTNVRKAMKENGDLRRRVKESTAAIPGSPDDYTFSIGEDVKDLVSLDTLKAFQQQAHKAKLTPAQAQELLGFQLGLAAQTRKAAADRMKKQAEETMNSLRAEYKEKTDAVVKDAIALVERVGGKELRDELEKTGLGNNGHLIRAFIKLAPLFNERGAGGAGSTGAAAASTGGAVDVDLKSVYNKSWVQMGGKL